MRKQIIALLAAILITGSIGLSMVLVGANALTNQNGTAVLNSIPAAGKAGESAVKSDKEQIAQLQAQVAQYQSREQQYQAALNSDSTQISQASAEMQMVQELLAYLQNRGLISIDSRGQILVTDH
jgi:peptidoglycan hydrolase CwlO-like protein